MTDTAWGQQEAREGVLAIEPAVPLPWLEERRRPIARPRQTALALLTLALIVCLALQLAWPLATLALHISSNNNEGWNAYWAARALTGLPLYTDAASPISNNYPPLSFYLVGGFGRLIGDAIVAGRLICLASLLGCTAMVAVVVDRFAGQRRWSLLAAGAFLLYIASAASRYVAADDPQWLAEAAMMAALVLLVGPTRSLPSRGRVVGACALMLVSGLIKHSQIALPIAVTATLALHDRRALITWLAAAAALGVAALAALHILYGWAFVDQVLHHQRVLHARYIGSSIRTLAPLLPTMIVALLLLRSPAARRGDPRLTLLFLFVVSALGVGIFERFGSAVAQNAHFDTALAVFILAGIALGRSSGGLRSATARLAAFALMLAPLVAVTAAHQPHNADDLANLPRTQAAWAEAVARLKAAPGPVACERPALCYWSGKPYALDVSNYGQKLRLGHDPIDLARQIAQHRFGAIVELRDKRYRAGDARLPAAYYRLIDRHYVIAQVLPDDLYLLVPRG